MVGWSHNEVTGVTGIGIVLHETTRTGRAGPEVARVAEAYDDVPSQHAECFVVLRAMQIARERGAAFVKIRGSFSQGNRGPIRPEWCAALDSSDAGFRSRWIEIAETFTVARTQWVTRPKTCDARKMAREACGFTPQRSPELFPYGPLPRRAATHQRPHGAIGDGAAWWECERPEDDEVDAMCEPHTPSDDEIPF